MRLISLGVQGISLSNWIASLQNPDAWDPVKLPSKRDILIAMS